MTIERAVGGLRCGEVLEHLSDYLDGEVTIELKGAIEAHVSECGQCARFGGAFAAVIQGVRMRLGRVPEAPDSRS